MCENMKQRCGKRCLQSLLLRIDSLREANNSTLVFYYVFTNPYIYILVIQKEQEQIQNTSDCSYTEKERKNTIVLNRLKHSQLL